MSFLKELLKEIASGGSTGAGSVASAPGSLLGGGVVDSAKNKRKQRHMLRRVMSMPQETVDKKATAKTPFSKFMESEEKFDQADVVSKLDAAEKKAKMNDKDVAKFGLEDEDGNVIKVFIDAEQAEEFEQALGALLAGMDDDDDDDNPDEPTTLEIAEILFKLKDKFSIIDVEWGELPEDEEEEQEVEGEGEGEMSADDSESTEDADGTEDASGTEDADELGASSGDEEAAKSALSQVIDAMKADAEAKKAEANAKEAESKAKEADYASRSAAAKVKQEEEVLDMESHYKDKQEGDKEAKKLAKLAKYKHEKASEAETKLATEDEEVSIADLAGMISNKLKEQ